MRVLITGAAGFIGSRVVDCVAKAGHAVWAAVRPADPANRLVRFRDQITIARVDLQDPFAVKDAAQQARPDCAIHLAWYTVPGKYWTALENLDCVVMTIGLAQALHAAGCKRIVAAGTCAEYEWNHGTLSEEFTPLRPRTLYGACKNATRQVLEGYCNRVSMEFAWTRFFHVYGPDEANGRLVPSVLSALSKGGTAACTTGEQVLDFLHVKDAAAAVWTVAKSDLHGAVNVASGRPTTVRQLVETIGRLLGASDRIAFGALSTDPAAPRVLVADVNKLTTHTGWQPAYSLEAGLHHVVSSWRSERSPTPNVYEETVEDIR